MTFTRRLYFYGLGVFLGILLSVVLFGPEKFSCANYLPNGRVLQELKTKKWEDDSIVFNQLKSHYISRENFKEMVLNNATINFEESNPRLKPCGEYKIYYPADSSKIIFIVSKCDSTAKINKVIVN